jgi:CDP-glucose 4,6-dehydratase
MNQSFWQRRRVLVTGHTGFKGAWLTLWLQRLGAEVHGLALEPPTSPSMFASCNVARVLASDSRIDIRDFTRLQGVLQEVQPEIIFHLAAKAIVRDCHESPLDAYSTNVMGTANLLQAVRSLTCVRALVVVTSDKCYADQRWEFPYRESDPLGGGDPYSSSKACAEIVTEAFCRSYFSASMMNSQQPVGVASVRSGNVVGGGDWAQDRLIPDIVRAVRRGESLRLRNPHARRPWQHVLEPLSGYLLLAERLCSEGALFSGAWNFGPDGSAPYTVSQIASKVLSLFGAPPTIHHTTAADGPRETHFLSLTSAKAAVRLGWAPRWTIDDALAETVWWFQTFDEGKDSRTVTESQIEKYSESKPSGRC